MARINRLFSREVLAGLVAIGSLALLYWGFNFLKGKDVLSKNKVLYAVYDRIDGLSAARPINLNGFQIGQVNRIVFHPSMDGRLIVELGINTDFPIARNSVARIVAQSLLGDKSVDLIAGDSPESVRWGDTLQSDIAMSLTEEVNRQVAPLKQKTEDLIGSIDTTITLINGFLTDDTRNNFKETFSSVRRSIQTLEHSVKTIDGMLDETRAPFVMTVENINSIVENLKNNEKELNGILKNTEQITDTLAKANLGKTIATLNRVLNNTDSIVQKVNDGYGFAGKMVNDPALYENLSAAADQLKLLLIDMKYNPNRYVQFSLFGNSRDYSPEEIREIEEAEQKRREAEAKP